MSDSGNPLATLLGGGNGQASGNQAQFGLLLQQIERIIAAILASGGGGGSSNAYFTTYAVTAAGDLDIASTYPSATAGIFVLRKTIPAPTLVTLPVTGGPWGVADGNGGFPLNGVTVQAGGVVTIMGQTQYFMSSAWQFATFVLDSTANNYIVGL